MSKTQPTPIVEVQRNPHDIEISVEWQNEYWLLTLFTTHVRLPTAELLGDDLEMLDVELRDVPTRIITEAMSALLNA